MAVVGNRKNRKIAGSKTHMNYFANLGTSTGDDTAITNAQEKLAEVKASRNKSGNKSLDKEITRLQNRIRKLRGVEKMDLKKNPLKIDNKGLTPNSKVVKKKTVKKKVVAKKKKVVVKKKKVVAKKNNPRKANRAGQKYGQR
jgi:hypothetical protein